MRRYNALKAEVDYWHKLTPQQTDWLKQFNQEFTGERFTKNPLTKCPEVRKAAYRSCYSARNDLMNLKSCKLVGNWGRLFK